MKWQNTNIFVLTLLHNLKQLHFLLIVPENDGDLIWQVIHQVIHLKKS